ncbi:MAG: Lrp/AsnC family transcriptional regulator [Alphaproteobacteria bacterium]|nr:Lrp/AsnC family transcriptional regulator [Alphaproteobacteria bacterium]
MTAAALKVAAGIDPVDRRIIAATQGGLPLCPRPFHAVAAQLGLDPSEVMRRFDAMIAAGIIRRVGAVPNHYALGFTANAMSVWDVDDTEVGRIGHRAGELDFVTHCYRRPRHPPLWPYNLFAMVHGRDREEVDEKVGRIAALMGAACRAHEVLYSKRILKKTGLRLAG